MPFDLGSGGRREEREFPLRGAGTGGVIVIAVRFVVTDDEADDVETESGDLVDWGDGEGGGS
jgi:hypothetical protein